MDLLLLFMGFVLLGHQFLFLLGIAKVKKLLTPVNLLQGIIPTMVLIAALLFQSWFLLVLAFVVERCWIMVELTIRSIRTKRPLSQFFYLQMFSFAAAIVLLVFQVWWMFACLYAAFWLGTLLQWKKRAQQISN